MIDVQSTTWRVIDAWLQRELANAREHNDRELDPAQTAALRGRIAALKDLMALPESIERDRVAREQTAGQYQAPTFSTPADYR